MSKSNAASQTPISEQFSLYESHTILPSLAQFLPTTKAPAMKTKENSLSKFTADYADIKDFIVKSQESQESHEIRHFFHNPGPIISCQKSVSIDDTENILAACDEDPEKQEMEITTAVHRAQVFGNHWLEKLSSHQKGVALIVALEKKYPKVIRYLLNPKTDADFYASDRNGETAMRVAARKGQLRALTRLLKAGCSVEPELHAIDQRNAIEMAMQSNQTEAVIMMVHYTNLYLSPAIFHHLYRRCKGESPIASRHT